MPETLEVTLPNVRTAVPMARGAVAAWLYGHVDRDVVRDAKLLVSELVTNGVRHGAGGELGLRAECLVDRFRVTVSDAGRGFAAHTPAEPDELQSGGRGLLLVDRIAADWGTSVDGACAVWFELQPKNTAAVS